MSFEPITGGCQCGAVRYALHSEPAKPHVCHCRMCQKAFGSYFAPLAGVPEEDFEVTRGTIAIFKSSDLVERGFCANCGTPLTFRYLKGTGRVSFSLGSLDHPERYRPKEQFGTESRMPWFAEIAHQPEIPTDEWGTSRPEWLEEIRRTNHQHPDHDTGSWPPAGEGGR